jgi:adenosylcobinamide-GDP ribazoletransferase
VTALRDTLNLFARHFAGALQSATRVRTSGAFASPPPAEGDILHPSTAHVPGAGWLVGIAACLVFALVSLALRGNPYGPLVAAIACTIATAALTGAMHETALFRFADGVTGSAPGAAGLGALTLFLVLAAKLALLAALASVTEAGVITALFAGHVVSRFALVVTRWAGSPHADSRSLQVGALWCLLPLVLMVPAGGVAFALLAVLGAAAACFAALRFCRSRPDAPGGERPGVVQQLAEIGFYLGAAIAA